ADQVLAHPQVVAVGPSPLGQARWSSAELIALESAVVEAALARRDGATRPDGLGVVGVGRDGTAGPAPDRRGRDQRGRVRTGPGWDGAGRPGTEGIPDGTDHPAVGAEPADRPGVVIPGWEGPELSGEQAVMVARLTGSGDGVQVVVGKAGSGKTTALAAARSLWERDGRRVLGAALSARAGAELEAGSGISSTTLARLLGDLSRPEARPSARVVIVVDEAAMVGTRDLARLLALAGPAQVVLVGDHRQLPEVAAGGVFSALADRLPVIELSENRRQAEAWERAALDHLREGRAAPALAAYGAHGRIRLADSPAGARATLVADWWADRQARPGASRLMVALRRDEVAALNASAHRILADAGMVGPKALVVGRASFSLGEEVVALRNDARAGLTNGARGVVVGIDGRHCALEVAMGQDRVLTVPRAYLEAGHLGLGYAVTLHKAQGATVERAFVLGTEALYREAGYVGLSRARARVDLYAVAGAGLTDEDPYASLTRRLGLSRGKAMASAAGPAGLGRLGPERDALAKQLISGLPPDPGPRLVGVEADLGRVRAGLSQDGPSAPVLAALEGLEATRSSLMAEASAREAYLDAQAERRDRLEVLNRAMADRRSLLGRAALVDPPEVVVALLGPRPDGLIERDAWRSGAEALLSYR
ncbi:MAG: AAA family ATPase, partial [Acidimicrobiales bacterium]